MRLLYLSIWVIILYRGKKLLPEILAFVQIAAWNFPAISAKLLLKHTLELWASVIHITCYKIEDGRRPPYWKLKNRHSSATITDISTEIGILMDMKLLLKLLAWQCEFHKIQHGGRPPYWRIKSCYNFAGVLSWSYVSFLHLVLVSYCVKLLFSYSATQPQVWNKTQCQCQCSQCTLNCLTLYRIAWVSGRYVHSGCGRTLGVLFCVCCICLFT